jgi:hydrogenase nickel incorporation protein HypA/HybF
MHELAATESILKLVLSEAEKAGAKKVTGVSLKVGTWSSFVPDCVEFYFGIIAEGTPAEGAKLSFEIIPTVYRCVCGMEYKPDETIGCPRCGEIRGALISGREFYVESIEVDGEDTGSPEGP